MSTNPRTSFGAAGNIGAALTVPGIVLTFASIVMWGPLGALAALVPAMGVVLLLLSD